MPFVQIQLRRGTAAEWAAINPTLAPGELVVETDTNLLKLGDGATQWDNQTYLGFTGPTGPGGGGPTGSPGPTGPASTPTKTFTLYLDYSSPTAISSVYVPPGLFTNPLLSDGGVFTSDVGTDLVFYGLSSLSLENTTYANVATFGAAGYIPSEAWVPVAGGNIGPTKLYYSMTNDFSVTVNGLGLTNINGGNTAVKPSGRLAGYLAMVTLTYI